MYTDCLDIPNRGKPREGSGVLWPAMPRQNLDQWEDDLESEQFMRDALANPSARVTRVSKTGSNNAMPAKPKSKFALQMENKKKQTGGTESFQVRMESQETERQREPRIAGLTGDIQERPMNVSSNPLFTAPPTATGFPIPKRRSISPERSSPRKSVEKNTVEEIDFTSENDARLASMTPEQVAEQQRELHETLSDKAIAYLMRKRKAATPSDAISGPFSSTSRLLILTGRHYIRPKPRHA